MKVFFKAGVKFQTVFSRIKVNMFTFKSPEEPFDVDVINSPAFAVHTDLDRLSIKKIDPVFTSELAALVGIDYLRFSILTNRCFKNLQRCICLKGVYNTP
jgi:hypothetical protein